MRKKIDENKRKFVIYPIRVPILRREWFGIVELL